MTTRRPAAATPVAGVRSTTSRPTRRRPSGRSTPRAARSRSRSTARPRPRSRSTRTARAVQSAIDALSNVEPGDVAVNCGNNPCTQPALPTQLISATPMTLVFDGQYAQENVPEITTDATGLTGTTPTAPVATTQQANLFHPAVVRRAPLGAQHERPARQDAADQGERERGLRVRPGQPVRPRRGGDAARDLRDGLPQPVPDPGRLRRRRLHDGLLAGLPVPGALRGPRRHRPDGDRPRAEQLRLAAVHGAGPAHVPVELQHRAGRSVSRTGARARQRAR